MAADSKVLLLTLGSFNQLPEGESEYSRQYSVFAQLPEGFADLLRDLRRQSFLWIKNAKRTRWKGVPVPQLKYNQTLTAGYDLGGEDPNALYFPALWRFQGRFFQTLSLEGKRTLLSSSHHVLFLCSLYGLIAPREPIQAYDSPLEPSWRLNDIWKTEGRLTQVLLGYLTHHGITRVFDFTAMSVRRNLIDWKMVREASVEVLHAVGDMGVGDDLLVPFAHLWFDEFLKASEADLLAIQFGSGKRASTQGIWFHRKPGPHAKGPREIVRDEWVERLERIQFGIIRFLDKLEDGCGKRSETTGKRVKRLAGAGQLPKKYEKAMYDILDLRNEVRYRKHKPTLVEMRRNEAAWNLLLSKVESEGWDIPALAGF